MANTTNKAKKDATQDKKVVTKYDRKVQKRKEEALKLARKKKITLGVLIAIVVAAAVGCSIWGIVSYNTIHNKYIKVNGEAVSGIEFDFYYGISKNQNLSQTLYGTMTYGDYYKSYMGYDSSKTDKSQTYSSSTSNTWYDYFANSTVNAIKQYKALLEDADKRRHFLRYRRRRGRPGRKGGITGGRPEAVSPDRRTAGYLPYA